MRKMKHRIENEETVDQSVNDLRKQYYKNAAGLTVTAVLFVFSVCLSKMASENAPYYSSDIAFFAAIFMVLPYVLGVYLALRYISYRLHWRDYPNMEAKLRENDQENIQKAVKYRRKIRLKLAIPVLLLAAAVIFSGCAYLESVRNRAWEYMESGDYLAAEELLDYYPANSYRDNGGIKFLAESLRYRAESDFSLADACARKVELEGLSASEQQRLEKYKAMMAVEGEREFQFEFVEQYAEREEKRQHPVSGEHSSPHSYYGSSHDNNDHDEEYWDGEEYINEDYYDLYDDEMFYDESMDE